MHQIKCFRIEFVLLWMEQQPFKILWHRWILKPKMDDSIGFWTTNSSLFAYQLNRTNVELILWCLYLVHFWSITTFDEMGNGIDFLSPNHMRLVFSSSKHWPYEFLIFFRYPMQRYTVMYVLKYSILIKQNTFHWRYYSIKLSVIECK